jgi:hypothetical protein
VRVNLALRCESYVKYIPYCAGEARLVNVSFSVSATSSRIQTSYNHQHR